MGSKIYAVVISGFLIFLAIQLRNFKTVSSLNTIYGGKGFGKAMLIIMYSMIGQGGTISLLIVMAVLTILLQFKSFRQFVRGLLGRGDNNVPKA